MKDVKVSLSVPAHIYSFGETKGFTQNKYVTHAKLKVFYVGQTGDNRVFTKQFSDQLLLTLPGTPVVAHFDPDKDDFIGHNYEQAVFGYVPDAATVEYLQEGDKLFAVTDVLLFTGREDSIGEIAKKIIGKQHSLELDPATVKYTIVRAGGKIDSITFNEGHFIGLSVLGDDEQPAFGGSEFFSESSTLSIRELGKVYRNFFHLDETNDTQDPSTTYKTENAETENTQMSEQQTEVELVDKELEVLQEEEVDFTAEPATEDTETFVEETNEDEEVVEAKPYNKEEEEKEKTEEVVEADETPEDIEDPKDEEVMSSTPSNHEVAPDLGTEPQIVEGTEDARENQKTEEESVAIANTAALNNAEREELNAYRKAAKYALIDSYTDLDETVRESFKKLHENFTVEQLDKELAFELVKTIRNQPKNKNYKVFSMNMSVASNKPDTIEDLIEKYKDKH
jgi:outer membrane biosynthesis protein TonB